MGLPTSWSAAIDQHASGALDEGERRRLYVVSAGNVRDLEHPSASYPELNRTKHGIDDPGQAWNALTVGAYTDRCRITHDDFQNHSPVAPLGSLSPKSRTSMMWGQDRMGHSSQMWFSREGTTQPRAVGEIIPCDDLRILTTAWSRTGKQLETMADTSAATALAARLAARLSAAYPEYWPETIRALLVHSAEWTNQMREEFPGNDKSTLRDSCSLLRVWSAGRTARILDGRQRGDSRGSGANGSVQEDG